MIRDNIKAEYFNWICDLLCKSRFAERVSYELLLRRLHEITFYSVLPEDESRAEDGVNLRYRFAVDNDCCGIEDYIDGPCSVLEMMAALALMCEEDIMGDPRIGDRTGQWFWKMIVNLGLGGLSDDRFDADLVDSVIDRFLEREYEPDGEGGLFVIRNCEHDLRDVEIWHQLCWYLDGIT